MRLLRTFACAILLMSSGSALLVEAQIPSSSSQNTHSLINLARTEGNGAITKDTFTLNRRIDEVQVRFTVVDRAGRPVTGLRPGDVQLFDDRETVTQLTSFELVKHVPLQVGIVLDLSESISSAQQMQTSIVSELLPSVIEPSRDKVFLVGFSSRVQLLQPPTAEVAEVRKALQQLPTNQNLTSLFDAIVQTCRNQFDSLPRTGSERRLMFLFSDGEDTRSIHNLEDAAAVAIHSGVTIYAISKEQAQGGGRAALQELASRTGGRFYLMRGTHQVQSIVAEVNASIRNEYALTFRPPNPVPGFHRLRMRSDSNRQLVFHLRTGYFLDPQ